jgi:hypothetical protein
MRGKKSARLLSGEAIRFVARISSRVTDVLGVRLIRSQGQHKKAVESESISSVLLVLATLRIACFMR